MSLGQLDMNLLSLKKKTKKREIYGRRRQWPSQTDIKQSETNIITTKYNQT